MFYGNSIFIFSYWFWWFIASLGGKKTWVPSARSQHPILDSLELWINLTILKSIKSQRFKNEISFYYARKIDIDLNIFKLGKNFSDQNG